MLNNGTAVRVDDRHGYAIRMVHASQGHRFWRVDWVDGDSGMYEETMLVDVDREEWQQVLDGSLADDQRCDSSYYGRRCDLRRHHRTALHRCCEIVWDDDTAAEYARSKAVAR